MTLDSSSPVKSSHGTATRGTSTASASASASAASLAISSDSSTVPLVHYPLTRIKKIMRADPDVNAVSQDALLAVTLASVRSPTTPHPIPFPFSPLFVGILLEFLGTRYHRSS